MGKRIYLILLGIISIVGIGFMIYFGIQPRPVQKIKLSKFESPTVFANSVLLRLRQELRISPMAVLGVQTNLVLQAEQLQLWREFLSRNTEEGTRFDKVYIDSSLETSLFPEAEKVNFQDEFAQRLTEFAQLESEKQRVVLIVPTTYSTQMVPNSLAHYLNLNLPQKSLSLSMVDFPRSRELEKDFEFQCVVEGVDQTGVGPFGCLLLQSARAQYRRRFQPGEKIGFMNQIGLLDYIVFYTTEK